MLYRSRKIIILSHYKFYLSFENVQLHDYVSEKAFEGLYSGTVPVYRGAARVAKVMPTNHSFVDANNLTPKQLAAELTRLSDPANQAEYETYLDYKLREPINPPSTIEKPITLSKFPPDIQKEITDVITPELCRCSV